MSHVLKEDIVVSGLSGRFPNSDNVDEFWDNLIAGTDMITSEPRRWPSGMYGLPERAGLLHNISSFDATFFGVSAKQAHQMDPHLRLLLEVVFEAILDSGYHPDELAGKKIGVYVGGSSSEAYDAWTTDAETQTGYGLLGCCRCMLANRISFTFDFRGPSYTLDTACSSSMFAVDAAMKAIQCGECDMAIAAGVNLLMKPNSSLDFHRLSMLSMDGCCKVFDERANGYVRSETIAAIILSKQSLSRRAYARVLGTRTNTDGHKVDGITYPNHLIQTELLKDLYSSAGVKPEDVFYLEMHGTGTQAGDTQEMAGVEKFFLDGQRKEPLFVGSVKSNMGHSEPSSGVAALAKVLMGYHYKKIPANINFQSPNTKLKPLMDGSVKPVISHLELQPESIIGVNSFGFGGANAHVILQGMSREEPLQVVTNIPMLVPHYSRISDETKASLVRLRDSDITHDKLGYMHMICENAPTTNLTRGFVVLNGVKKEPVIASTPSESNRPLWFVMTGMGAQWPEMGKDMMRYETFRKTIESCSAALRKAPDCKIDLMSLLMDPNANLATAENAFVGLCAVQIGLVNLLTKFGLKPDGILGHSVGELVCGYADGCLDEGQTILAAFFRGRCIRNAELGEGGMAAVGLTWEEAMAECPDGVVPACHNAQDSVTISGDKKAVAQVVENLKARDIFAKAVNSCGVAFHSPVLANIGPQLAQCLEGVITKPKIRSPGWICTSRQEAEWPLATHCSAAYLSNNLVNPVRFHDSLKHVPANAIVVEIAACGLLQAILKRALPTASVISLMKRNDPKCVEFFLNSIGTLWNLGVNPRFGEFYEAPSLPLVDLPPMAGLVSWDHSVQYTTPNLDDFSKGGGGGVQVSYSYKVDTTDASNAYTTMVDHVIDGRNLLPATGYLYFVWKAIASSNHSTVEQDGCELRDIKLHQATILSTAGPSTLTVTLSPGAKCFEVTAGDALVVSGKYVPDCEFEAPVHMVEGTDMVLGPEAIYKEFRLRGYEYGPLYQGIASSDSKGIAGALRWTGDWVSFLDTMLQVQLIGNSSRALRLPTRIRRIQINPLLQSEATEIPFNLNPMTKQCWAGGVVIEGLHTTLAQRRADLKPVMLETYNFTPYTCTTPSSLTPGPITSHTDAMSDPAFVQFLQTASLRSLLDIAQENLNKSGQLSVCEIGGLTTLHSLSLTTLNTNPGRPECQFTPVVCSEREKEVVDDESGLESLVWDITSQQIQKKFDIIMTSSYVCSSDAALENVLSALTPEGFLVYIRAAVHSVCYTDLTDCLSAREGLLGDLVLLRAKQNNSTDNTKMISVSNTEFTWVETLQSAVLDPTVARIWLEGDESSGVMGLCNALRQEDCKSKIRCILSSEAQSQERLKEIIKKDLVVNVNIGGQWGTYRHNGAESVATTTASFAYVDTLTRGDLSSLSWIQAPISTKTENKTICDVDYASLNFRDIMIATGKLPPDALPVEMQGSNDCVLGLEFSGRNEAKERVMGILPVKALATKVITETEFTWQVPDSWSLEAAASVPVVYCTAYYSLIVRGRLRAGESVLIHSGSGGVGQAAISIALAMGCEVFTTCGSPEKVNFLLGRFPKLQRDHIMNSRSTKFEEDLMSMTQSKGVHVVLNSLADDKLKASLRCVARHGRFLEIGKYDLSEDNAIGLSVFLKNISFHGILLDALFEAGNSSWQEVRDMLSEGIKAGVVQPLPTTCFKNTELEQAFRYMAQGKHIGKVVICTRDEAGELPKTVTPRFSCHANKTYIVTGGLGGFGLELVQWLVDQGARNVVITSRSGARSEYQKWVVKTLTQRGAAITIATQDTTQHAGVEQLLKEVSHPVTAIFHLAGILRDGLLENLTPDSFREVFGPKVATAQHLDSLSRTLCPELEHFVAFSSVVSGRGNSGQCNYAAANSAIERICDARKSAGYPGLAIQWGAIGDVGMAHSMVGNDANIGGTYPQRIWNCISTMAQCMMLDCSVASSIVLADKQSKASSGGDGADLVTIVANIMGASDPSKLDHNATLGAMGLDSLMGVEVKQALDRADIQMSNKEIRGLTLNAIKALTEGGEGDNKKKEKALGSLVLLKSVADTTPLYLVHPITLDLGPLENIAQHLPYTVYGIQFTDAAPIESVKTLASYYLSQIREKQPSGPYRLGGYSLGSVIAFEMALQLEQLVQSGEVAMSDVEYLGLVDGSPNWVHGRIEMGKDAEMKRAGVVDKPTGTILGYIREMFGSEPEGLYEKMTPHSPNIDKLVKIAMDNLVSGPMAKMVPADCAWKMTNFTKLLLMSDSYLPEMVMPGPVHLVKALDSYQIGEDYGLSDLCKGAVTVNSVPGTHESCVVDSAQLIAQHIAKQIN